VSRCSTHTAAERELPLHDRERLGALLSGLEPRLEAVALRITRHPDSARDVVQSAFEKVIRHGSRFQGRARVSTWVHRIVANEALMWLRSQRRRAEVSIDTDPVPLSLTDTAPGPGDQLQQLRRAERLRAGLETLPAAERDVVLHCTLAGESYAAYGARTGVHPAAVKSRAFRARRRLEKLLHAPHPGSASISPRP
jgi:RNA polymerase sigma-70 factor (ECF subfamily)